MIQIREKQLDAITLFRLSKAVKKAAKGIPVLLNERADIAAAAALDGVHLRESSCPPDRLTPLTGSMLVGKSVHSPEAALEAETRRVDYLFFGPVFDTPSKRHYGTPQGLTKLRAICKCISLPIFAIGGITAENTPHCLSEGAYGIAALSLFSDPEKLSELLRTFQTLLAP